jgi:hypothetical protein
MPRFNQTGPAGMGPMTGWGRGMCNTATPANGPGADDNAGFGRGRGPYFQAYPEDAQFELGRLKNEAANMQNALEAISARITEMENN